MASESNNRFRDHLEQRLRQLDELHLRRELRRIDSAQSIDVNWAGRSFVNFSSNDYLGLATHPEVVRAASQAAIHFGAGSGASRLICGSLAPHHELERALAAFKQTEGALAFSSGYAAALGAIPAVVGTSDVIVIDKLVHASIVDAARLSGAKLRVFKHNDIHDLERILGWTQKRRETDASAANQNVLVVTESVFSMDGDLAPLAEIVEIKEKFGAWLMVDEAHATGLYGEGGCGLVQENEIGSKVEVQMGTLSKAVGASGGYVCGARPLVELLVNHARSFIYSTAPVPAAAAAARAGLEVIASSEGNELRGRLWSHVERFASALGLKGWRSAIIPIHVGGENQAMALAAALREEGFLIPAVRYPTVARGEARLRVTLSAAHSEAQIDRLVAALRFDRLGSGL